MNTHRRCYLPTTDHWPSSRHQCLTLWILLVSCLATVDCFASDTKIVNSYPILYEDGNDNYLLLSENELTKNAEILKYLSSSSKEEVEEIVEGNPLIQNQLLDRVTKIVQQRKQKNIPRPFDQQTIGKVSQQQWNPPVSSPVVKYQQKEVDNESKDDELDESSDDKGKNRGPMGKNDKKLLLLKAKLGAKATKWFKIGTKLKQKLLRMKKKKNRKNKGGFFRITNRNKDVEDDDEDEDEGDKDKKAKTDKQQKTKKSQSTPFRFKITTS